jgi:hypothetical protein
MAEPEWGSATVSRGGALVPYSPWLGIPIRATIAAGRPSSAAAKNSLALTDAASQRSHSFPGDEATLTSLGFS